MARRYRHVRTEALQKDGLPELHVLSAEVPTFGEPLEPLEKCGLQVRLVVSAKIVPNKPVALRCEDFAA